VVEQVLELWRTSDIGDAWLDLRGLVNLKSLVVEGVAAVWLPHTLEDLQVDSQGCFPLCIENDCCLLQSCSESQQLLRCPMFERSGFTSQRSFTLSSSRLT